MTAIKSNVVYIENFDRKLKSLEKVNEEIFPKNVTDFLAKKLGKKQHISDVVRLIIKYLTRRESIDKDLLKILEDEYIPARIMVSLCHDYPEKNSNFLVPLRIYIKNNDQEKFNAIEKAVLDIAKLEEIFFGFSTDHLKGSIFKKILGIFNISSENKQRLQERLAKVEEAINDVQKMQKAQIDKELSTAAAALISTVNSVDESVVCMGSIVIIKTNNNGKSRIISFNMTSDQVATIEKNPSFFKNPNGLLRLLEGKLSEESLATEESTVIPISTKRIT